MPAGIDDVSGVAAAGSLSFIALASDGGAMPAHMPSALIRSSGAIGRCGVSGGVSSVSVLPRIRGRVANQSASRENMSPAPEQPASKPVAVHNSGTTISKRRTDTLVIPLDPALMPTPGLRHDRGCAMQFVDYGKHR